MRTSLVFIFLSACFYAGLFMQDSVCFAQSEFDSDEELVFGEDAGAGTEADKKPEAQTLLTSFMNDAIVTLSVQFSHGTDSPEKVIDNQTSCRLEYSSLVGENLFFKFDGKAALYFKNDHIAETKEKDAYGEGSIRELYLQPGFERANLSFGKQILVWGKADTAAITDVVAPRDLSQFLFIELEDARLGQWMISGSYFGNQWKTFVFLSPLPETDETPDRNTRYYRESINEAIVSFREDEPGFGDLEFGIKLDTTFSKTDVSIMAGQFYSNAFLYEYRGITGDGRLSYEQVFPSYRMLGTAVSHAWKNFIFKLETAFKEAYPLQGVTQGGLHLVREREVLDAAAGIEYDANDKYQVTLEICNRWLVSGTSGLMPGTDENSTALYATVSKDFFNQTLNLEYTIYQHFQEKNRFHQFKITCDLTDNIELTADYTFFNITDTGSQMWPYRNEDRIGFKISFFF